MARLKRGFSGAIRYKLEPEITVSQYELNKLRANPFDSLLNIENVKGGELVYEMDGQNTLAQEFSAGIDEKKLISFVRQTLMLVSVLNQVGLSRERLILSPEYISCQTGSDLLKFVYLPVNGEAMRYDEILFIRDLVLQAKLSGKSRIRWDAWCAKLVRTENYEKILKSIPMSGEERNEHLKNKFIQHEEETDLDTHQQVESLIWENQQTENEETILDDDGEAATGVDEENAFGADWLAKESDDSFWIKQNTGGKALWKADNEAPTAMDEMQSIDLMDQADGTFFESVSEWTNNVAAKLIDLKDGKAIVIKKDEVKLGRSVQRADYRIDNNSISNVHAVIIRKGGQYFLQDNHSTNGTYLNETRLDPNKGPVVVKNGDVIRLWNLEYRFVSE